MNYPSPELPVEREALQRVWDLHGLGAIRTTERLSRGVINHATLVNETFVIRFDTLGTSFPKPGSGPLSRTRFLSEAFACHLLADRGLPTPQVVALDDSRQILRYPYLITTRLPGQPLIELWNELEPTTRQTLAYQAGEWLARMHYVTFKRFGQLKDILPEQNPPGGFDQWAEYVVDHCQRFLTSAEKLGALDQQTIQAITSRMERAQSQLEIVQIGSLIHSDYHFENLLAENGRLTGLIDLEWAFSADPTWDFTVQSRWEATCPGSEAPLLAGYTAHRQLDKGHAARLHLYRIIIQLEIVVNNTHSEHPKTVERARQSIAQLLSEDN